jgi:hypothetical protein
MNKKTLVAGVITFTLTLFVGLAVSAADSKSLTGVVSDTMCGAKHAMSGDAAACTRKCVAAGSSYALVVGDNVYTLEGAKDQLDKYAGEKVTVTGDVQGNTVKVASVKPAKGKM